MVSLAWENNATGRIFTVQNPDFAGVVQIKPER
jgi:hypothetical protein